MLLAPPLENTAIFFSNENGIHSIILIPYLDRLVAAIFMVTEIRGVSAFLSIIKPWWTKWSLWSLPALTFFDSVALDPCISPPIFNFHPHKASAEAMGPVTHALLFQERVLLSFLTLTHLHLLPEIPQDNCILCSSHRSRLWASRPSPCVLCV